MAKLKLVHSGSGKSTSSIQSEIISKLVILLNRDPEGSSEFLTKLEVRLWEKRLKQAGTDTKKLSKLLAVLFGRVGPIQKKLKLKTGNSLQLSLDLGSPGLGFMDEGGHD